MIREDEFYKTLVDSLDDGVYFVDRERVITYWNKGAEAISGYATDRVIGRRCGDGLLMHADAGGRILCGSGCPLAATMEDGRPRQVEAWLHHRDGHRVPVRIRAQPMRDASGAIVGAVEMFEDDWQRQADRERIAELERVALLDPLTQLGNRRYGELELHSKLGELERFARPFGVLFFDVDHFKRVNDEHGHEVGDRILRMVANTARLSVRAFDHLCRWGGDEFLAVIAHVDRAGLARVGEKIRALVAASSLEVRGGKLTVAVSIGAALGHAGDSAESLIGRADRLMYESKSKGGGCATLE